MTTTERHEFLQSRIGAVGGSDMGSLLSTVLPQMEYGCARNLWAKLSLVPTDNPDRESEYMSLGNIIEPFIRRAYAEETGRRVEQFGLRKHATIKGVQYHDDSLLYPAPDDHRKGTGVLECKGTGTQMLRKIQEDGLPIDYVCQVQAGLSIHLDCEYGAFAVAVREDIVPLIAIEQAAILNGDPIPKMTRRPKIIHFEVERQQDIIDAIEEEAPRMLASVGKESEAPPRLDIDDPRCGRCPRKIWCHGPAIAAGLHEDKKIPIRQDLVELAEEYRINTSLLEQTEALVKDTQDKFRTALGTTTAVKVPVDNKGVIEFKPVYYRLQKGRETIDGQALAAQYDALRRAAAAAGVPGVELVPPSSEFSRKGMPSRPLRLQYILPPKPKKKGEVPEQDEPDADNF